MLLYRHQQDQSSFLAHLAKGQVSYYHHLASVVVRRRPSLTILKKIFSSGTTEWIYIRFAVIVPWHNMHTVYVMIFDSSKNMAAVTKNRTKGSDRSFLPITQKTFTLAKFWQSKSIQHDEIHLHWNFQENPSTLVGVIALFRCFLQILKLLF